jgi:uncharacterized protein (TIGR01370 family)
MPENGIYVLQGIVPAQIAAAPVGVKVVDIYNDDGDLFTSSQVSTMESGGGTVLGYFSIGEAENYRPYFSSLPSSILGPQDPSFAGDFQVAYWTDTWKTVSENYIQTMLDQGYQGCFLDVVDECDTAWAQANAPGGAAGAKAAMVSLIEDLAAYAHAQNPNFKVWINISGSEELASNPALVSTIDGAYEEELFYQDNGSPQSKADVDFNLNLLDNITAAGKPVVAVEYVTGAATVAAVHADADAAGIGSYIANPNLELDGVDTEGFAGQVCFARGTMIATPTGEIPVEKLEVGEIVAMADGLLRSVVWIGTGRVSVLPGHRTAATPVIVRQGAISPNEPNRDLRITKGHSLLLDGYLIPIECLINHRSIVWDDRARDFDIYHVQTECHGVLLANGVAAESYRDDGNSWLFDNPREPEVCDPCAPILTGGPIVDEIWHRLLDRAGPRPGIPTTEQPDLHLVVDGQRVDGSTHIGPASTHVFRLKDHPTSVHVVSRCGIPEELGIARDPRPLGVAVKRIEVWHGRKLRVIGADAIPPIGFHPVEPDHGFRWTNGDGALPPWLFRDFDGPMDIVLVVGATSRYPLVETRA